jgi:hypothetical protein
VNDDDPTPPGRPRRRAQTATERDLEGIRARHERAQRSAAAEAESLESERTRQHSERKAARSHAHGVPVIPDHVERELGGPGEVAGEAHEITEPWKTLDREELKPYEATIVERSKRNSSDPITVADWAKTMALVMRRQLDERSEEKRRADAYMAVLDATPSGRLAARVAQLERALSGAVPKSWLWRAVGLMATTILGSAVAIVATLQSSSEQKGRLLERIDTMNGEITRLRNKLEGEGLGDRHRGRDQDQSTRWLVPPMPTTKDTP